MGTRGFVGLVIDGVEKIGYNHSDSYPEGLGLSVLEWLKGISGSDEREAATAEAARALRVVTADDQPSDEDIEHLKRYANMGVGDRDEGVTWYKLLRETQGDLAAILAAGAIEDASKFPMDSLFAEWGYLVDLDAKTFEVYQGFQGQPHDKGRFGSRERTLSGRSIADGYYPVALVKSWPLGQLPEKDDFLKALDNDEDDD